MTRVRTPRIVASVSLVNARAAWIEIKELPESSEDDETDVLVVVLVDVVTVELALDALLAGVELASELDGVVTPQAASTNIAKGNRVIFLM